MYHEDKVMLKKSCGCAGTCVLLCWFALNANATPTQAFQWEEIFPVKHLISTCLDCGNLPGPEGNRCEQMEKMQTPHRKVRPGPEIQTDPWPCGETVLTTVPLCWEAKHLFVNCSPKKTNNTSLVCYIWLNEEESCLSLVDSFVVCKHQCAPQ